LTSLSDSSSISSKCDSKNYDLDENDGVDLDKSVSDEEMNELFLNIESSCESIINKTIDSTKINPEPDNIELKIVETQLEEKEEYNTEIKDDLNIIETTESDPDPEPEPETKKKRTYKPRKKKD
jgi:hypothetical protein